MTEGCDVNMTEGEGSDSHKDKAIYRPFSEVSAWMVEKIQDEAVVSADAEFRHFLDRSDSATVQDVILNVQRQAAAESVAVEGFYKLEPGQSRSIAAKLEGWQKILTAQSPDNLALFQSQLDAFEYARQHAEGGVPVTETFLRELHVKACSAQVTHTVYVMGPDGNLVPQEQNLEKGVYKKNPNNVFRRDGSTYWYASVEETGPEMKRFVEQLRSGEFQGAHPLVQIAYAHHALTQVHPFADGNGRVARALASVYSYRAYGVPFIVYADRKMTYFQALEAATIGKHSDTVNHFADRTVSTLSHASQQLESRVNPTVHDRLDSLLSSISSHSEITLDQVNDVKKLVESTIESRLKVKVAELSDASGGRVVELSPGRSRVSFVSSSRYTYGAEMGSMTTLGISEPTAVSSSMFYIVGSAYDLGARFIFCLVASPSGNANPGGGDTVSQVLLRFDDCFPKLSASVLDRVELFIESGLSYVMDQLNEKLRNMLRQAGMLKDLE
jgi:Fic family protein